MEQGLRQFLLGEGFNAIAIQKPDGSMQAGHNGPYRHVETPLRNTCHWLVLWCHCYLWSNDRRFYDAASRALAYILLPVHRPSGGNWLQRSAKHRDSCNGVIGAAWVIEALTCAAQILTTPEALSVAEEVFSLHPFDEHLGIWRRVEVDGTHLPYDRTFNHQLWFAASAARLSAAGSQIATSRALTFLDALNRLFSVYRNGMIVHRIRLNWWDLFLEPWSPVHKAYVHYDQFRRNTTRRLDASKRDIGYHAFNLHAFAVLHRFFPNHDFWHAARFRRALAFSCSKAHRDGVGSDNSYASPYNPVGFEMGLTLQEFFPDAVDERREWVMWQISLMTRAGATEYGLEADDPITAKARLYEAAEIIAV